MLIGERRTEDRITVTRAFRTIGVISLLVAASTAAFGAKSKISSLTPPQWREALLELSLDPDSITNPAAFTPEIIAASRSATERAKTPLEKLDQIQQYLFDPDNAFTYDFVGTLTAGEAFKDRKGNCVAFTNLFISMSRAVGIPVQAALVSPRKGAAETEGDLELVKNHIVALYRHSAGSTVYDFYTSRTGAPVAIQPIDDLWNAAIYINNLGVTALKEQDLELALVRFSLALQLAPNYAPVYGNAGVALRRMGDTQGAFDYYLLALLIEPRNLSIRGNLLGSLDDKVELADQALLATDAESPEYSATKLMARATNKLAMTRVKEALSLYRRAHRAAPEWIEPVIAMAQCELLLGHPSEAGQYLGDALAMDATNTSALRLSFAIDRIYEEKGDRKRNRGTTEVVDPEPSWRPNNRGPGSNDPL
jgi:tetratricopeptide (TPR) repeat protein